MTQKTLFLFAACVGLVLVAGLMFSGADPERAARSGPRWRRYLISAALLILAALGVRYVLQDKNRDRTTPEVMCYSMPVSPNRPTLSTKELLFRFQRGLEQLDRLAAQGKLDLQTVIVRLGSIEKELTELSKTDATPALTAQELEQAVKLREAALEQIDKLRARLSQTLEDSEDWQIVVGFWRHCVALQTKLSSKEMAPSMQVVRDTEARHREVLESLARMARCGLLHHQERELLTGEAQRLSNEICVPIKIAATCYDSTLVLPEQVSLSRLSNRIVLLNALLKSGKVQPCVVERLLPSLEQDLQVLATAKRPPAQVVPGRPDPQEVEEEARELIGKLKACLPHEAGELEQPR